MSAIEWTDVTLNPVIGCSKISAGCSNCYASDTAASLATRFPNGAGQRYLAVLDDQHKRWNGRVIDVTASAEVQLADYDIEQPAIQVVTVADRGTFELQLTFARAGAAPPAP